MLLTTSIVKMNLQQLEYIWAVDKYKNFSKAAEVCFVTQATLSTMVKRLEEELGVTIFDRKSNPIITTDCGIEILKEAQLILHHSKQLKQLALEVKGIIEGEIKIGVIPTIAGNLIHRIIPNLLDKYPNLKLNFYEITTEELIGKLKSGELDIGIASTPLNHPEIEEEILYYEKLLVYGNIGKGKTKYRNPEEIPNENIWLLEQGNCLTDQVTNLCNLNTKKIHKNLSFSPNSFDSLLNLVDQLKGLTLIPELYYQDLPIERKAMVKDFQSPYPVREISIIHYRPYAKHRIIEALSKEIKHIMQPILQTSKLKSSEMKIAKMQ